jgi:spore coat protein U-like protein
MKSTTSIPPRRRIVIVAALIAVLGPIPALACTVEVASLAFGNIDPLDGFDTDSVTTLTVSCPVDTQYSASVSAGSGTFADRHMGDGIHTLNYQLFTEASRSLVWGDGSAGTNVIQGTAGSTGASHSIYGHVPAQPYAVPATYSDTLLVTITY